jgi:transposase
VSTDSGIERFDIYDQAITATEFIKHLEKLRKINGDTSLAIFMDQLGVHKTKEVVQRYKELDIVKIENVSYSPEFNPIESCFSQVKRVFCRERLNCLVNNRDFDTEKHIKNAMKVITQDLVKACATKSLS